MKISPMNYSTYDSHRKKTEELLININTKAFLLHYYSSIRTWLYPRKFIDPVNK